MISDVLEFHEIDRTMVADVGGKAANLGELTRLAGIDVPPGFCVTTAVFQRTLAAAPDIDRLIEELSRLPAGDRSAVAAHSAVIRRSIGAIPLDDAVITAVRTSVTRLGDGVPVAVRSSATAEDLPWASFAGQHDSFLDVVGPAAVIEHVRRCWASLYTERAVSYRMRNGIDHRQVRMAVVVQRMVAPDAAGVLFTADPVTGKRTVAKVEATVGLGDALVTGRVNPDVYTVNGDAVLASPARRQRVLTDDHAMRLVTVGRRIEAHFEAPQDVEWCLVDDRFHVVQSRPITTLFPIPEADDDGDHVYISVGHQQMMTDAMKPLGLSVWQLTAMRPMFHAGGRLFVDVADGLAAPASRGALLAAFAGDPLLADAVRTLLEQRGDAEVSATPSATPSADAPAADAAPAAAPPIAADPTVVAELVAEAQASIAAVERDIVELSGPQLFDFILSDLDELKWLLFQPRSTQVITAGMDAARWLNEQLEAWLGERNVADTLTQSVPDNVTSAMGLALLDVADAIRPHPQVVSHLRGLDGDGSIDSLSHVDGGRTALEAISSFLAVYGMRCAGEIDITRPRWSERPAALVPAILGNVAGFEAGEATRRFERGRRDAAAKELDVVERVRAMPDGDRRAAEVQQMIDRVRAFAGYREFPKYAIVSRYAVYKRALLAEADRLVRAGVFDQRDDCFFLTFHEFHDAARTHAADHDLIRRRRADFASFRVLEPPRVMTSDGEMFTGEYRRDDVPSGALAGLAVSAGTVEGRARVVLDMADADLRSGDILVTAFTDPSWTPLFVAVAGLVTEVGGLMTHGAVIAREYGLPAVVGVVDATRLIRDGQLIRVNGRDGYVEILDGEVAVVGDAPDSAAR